MERVAALLNQPAMAGVRQQFLGIDSGPVPLSVTSTIDGIGRYFTDGMEVRDRLVMKSGGARPALPADYPVTWKNRDDGLEVRITLAELP